MKSPQRGEVWLVDLGMAAKVRPALAMSVPADDSDRALVTLVPTASWVPSDRLSIRWSPGNRTRRVGWLCR
jgi:mRNA interferase MazF